MFDILLECLIIGDSIANGISMVNKQCSAIVKNGITSDGWLKENKNHPTYLNNKYKIIQITLLYYRKNNNRNIIIIILVNKWKVNEK